MAARRVLLIDEDMEIRRCLGSALMHAGWQAEDAEGGLAGLERIRQANSDGQAFCRIITEAFLPDLDGKLFLRALRAQYPRLPLIVLTGFGDAERRALVDGFAPSAYFEKPAVTDEILAAIRLFPDSSTADTAAMPPADSGAAGFEAYAYLRLGREQNAVQTYTQLRSMDGVRIIDTVRGDYDLILRLGADGPEALNAVLDAVKSAPGVQLAQLERIEQPRLSPHIEEFLRFYESVATVDRADYIALNETNAYLFIDLDRYQLERIHTSILMTEGVISCHASSGGGKLTVLMSGAVRPNVTRHLLHKLATMDGIRRVREATVINIPG